MSFPVPNEAPFAGTGEVRVSFSETRTWVAPATVVVVVVAAVVGGAVVGGAVVGGAVVGAAVVGGGVVGGVVAGAAVAGGLAAVTGRVGGGLGQRARWSEAPLSPSSRLRAR